MLKAYVTSSIIKYYFDIKYSTLYILYLMSMVYALQCNNFFCNIKTGICTAATNCGEFTTFPYVSLFHSLMVLSFSRAAEAIMLSVG